MAQRRYTAAQREGALKDAATLGITEAARRYGASPSAVRRWRSESSARDVRLGPGGPPAGVTTAPPKRGDREQHPLLRADVSKVHSALMESFRGRPATLQDLYDDMLDRDGRVASVVATRVLSIQGRPWSVKPPEGYEDDQEAALIANRCGLIIARIKAGGSLAKVQGGGGWSTCVGNIASAIPRGYSVQENEWGLSREGWKVPLALHWRHQNRFVFTPELEIQLADSGGSAAGVPLDTWGPDKFVVHSPVAGRAGYPTRRGVMLGMVLPSLSKRSDLKGWLKAVERWGQPIAIAEVEGARPSDQAQAELLEMLRSLYHGSNGVFWGGVKVKALDGSGQLRSEVFRDLIQELNTEIAIVGLGQNLTTEVTGGSFAAASAHNLVRYDILTADCAEIDATITAQLLEPIVRYNWPGAPVPRYVTEIQLRAEPTLQDVQAGLFTPDERRASLGHKPMPDGQGADFAKPAAPVVVPDGTTAAPDEGDAPTPGADLAKPASSDAATPDAAPASAAALNGAQIDALQNIILSVANGVLPRETAAKLIAVGFPLTPAQATDLLVDVVVTPPAAAAPPVIEGGTSPAAPPGGADTGLPFETTRSAVSSTSPTSERWSPGSARELFNSLAASGRSPSSRS